MQGLMNYLRFFSRYVFEQTVDWMLKWDAITLILLCDLTCLHCTWLNTLAYDRVYLLRSHSLLRTWQIVNCSYFHPSMLHWVPIPITYRPSSSPETFPLRRNRWHRPQVLRLFWNGIVVPRRVYVPGMDNWYFVLIKLVVFKTKFEREIQRRRDGESFGVREKERSY